MSASGFVALPGRDVELAEEGRQVETRQVLFGGLGDPRPLKLSSNPPALALNLATTGVSVLYVASLCLSARRKQHTHNKSTSKPKQNDRRSNIKYKKQHTPPAYMFGACVLHNVVRPSAGVGRFRLYPSVLLALF